MAAARLSCTRCGAPVAGEAVNAPGFVACPACGSRLLVRAFPALSRQTAGDRGEPVLLDAEAGCFYHPGKKAETVCDSCGRFLCALCDLEVEGRNLCPPCVEQGERKGKLPSLENERVLHDEIALALAVVPVLFVFATVVTAPLALYTAIRHRKTPTSIIPRTRFRLYLAALLAVVQMGAWGWILWASVT